MITYPSTPPSRIETWLATLDGPVMAGVLVAVFALMIVIPGLIVRLGKTEPSEPVRTRATTSGRKSGRVRS